MIDICAFCQYVDSSPNTYLTVHERKGAQLHLYILNEFFVYILINFIQENLLLWKLYNQVSGCRVVELDCWNGDYGLPMIYHGHDENSIPFSFLGDPSISFRLVSVYPAILLVENHCCSAQQQAQLAQVLQYVSSATVGVPLILI